MSRPPLRRVHLQHPWLVGSIETTSVYIRGQDDTDRSGFTRTEAEALFDLLIFPNFHQLMTAGITRHQNTFRSTGHGEREICVCVVGNQLQVFPENPAVDIVTAKWRSDGRLHHETDASIQPAP